MAIELRVISGTRAGQRESFDKSVVAVGRHPLSDLRFDAQRELEVSGRHAELRVGLDGRAVLHDLGSTNGTFVNGERLDAPRIIEPGDVIAFGADGPQVEFRTVAAAGAPPPAVGAAPAAPAAPAAAPSSGPAGSARRTERTAGPSTGERVAIAVQQQTRSLRMALGGGALLLAATVGAVLWASRRDRVETLDAVQRLGTQVALMDSLLRERQRESDSLRQQIASATASGRQADVQRLQRDLQVAERRRTGMTRVAAQADFGALHRANSPAVAMLAVELPGGKVVAGTGFAVTSDGLVVTNRHVVQADDGSPATRVAVIFADTRQWFPARVVRVSADTDLAVLRVEADGPLPVVRGVAAGPPGVGDPVALIGYPLGTDTPMEGRGTAITARTTLGVGSVSKVLGHVLQVDAYAGSGSSGSPVFDARGMVVGVVYGGAAEAAGRIVYAVPAASVRREIAAAN